MLHQLFFPGFGREVGIFLPPVDAHFHGFVNRTNHKQPDFYGQQVDICNLDFYIACNYDPFIEYSFENIGKTGRIN